MERSLPWEKPEPIHIPPEAFKVTITEKAASVFKESCEAESISIDSAYLRLGANSGGCSGYRYELGYANESDVRDSDDTFVSEGVNIVVDHKCLHEILGPVEIDYSDKNMVEQGFVFKQNINGKQCGCGESFTAIKDL